MKIPYNEVLKYRYTIPNLYDLPTFRDEYMMVMNEIAPTMKVLDMGCGTGRIYTDVLIPEGFQGEYVGFDPDESLDVKFPLHHSIDEIVEKYGARYFDVIIYLNVWEHMTVEELFDELEKINKLVDGKIIVMTPNPKCFDYMFGDPEHVAFYPHYWLYGIAKVFGFDKIKLARGKGVYQDRLREAEASNNPQLKAQVKAMNEWHVKTSQAMGLDWFGNLFMVGERE